MIEHRLYCVERDDPNPHYNGQQHRYDIVIITPSRATWYGLQGYTLFDLNKGLGIDPVYYKQEREFSPTDKHVDRMIDSMTK